MAEDCGDPITAEAVLRGDNGRCAARTSADFASLEQFLCGQATGVPAPAVSLF